MALTLSVLPIILAIASGYILVVTRILPAERWGGIQVLSFRLLIPVFLIKAIVASELSLAKFGPLVLNLVLSLALAGLFVFALRWIVNREHLPDPAFTTLFQGTTRCNFYISLAAAEQLIGAEGLTLIAVALACLVPLINVVNIVVLSIFGTGQARISSIALALAKNPLIQGCVLGLAINLSGFTLPEAVFQAVEIIGRAALGVGLLAIGAGMELSRLLKKAPLMWLGTILRLGLCPGLFILLAHLSELSPTQMLAGVLVLAVPAAPNGYIVAKQMGGDADLYADVLIWQTVLSMLLLPALALLLAAP
jgi:predicted permease